MRMYLWRVARLLAMCSVLLAPVAARAQGGAALRIYFIDAEGGQSTLVVAPGGESLLIDAGYAGSDQGDAKRIAAAAHDAGLAGIDYFLNTHFHIDHIGGVPELARLVPIRTFIDNGTPVERDPHIEKAFDAYARVRRKGVHLEPKPGDRLPLKGIDVDVVSQGGTTISKPLAGAGQPNPACTSFQRAANDATENSRSIGVRLQFGAFRFVDLGDLLWNKLGQLVCPANLIGEADVYLVPHHGHADSAVTAVLAALRPRVVVMNNGETKGGDAEGFAALRGVPGLDEDIWQLHRSANRGAQNADDAAVANLDERTGHWILLTASDDGSFSVTNGRTGLSKHYNARPAAPPR